MGHGSLACMGNLHAKTSVNGLMPDVHSFPYPYPYRDPFGLGGDAAVKAACNFFERTLKDPENGITKPACVILEANHGEGGVIPAPVEFLKTVRRVTKELGILLILDEIQCGMDAAENFLLFSMQTSSLMLYSFQRLSAVHSHWQWSYTTRNLMYGLLVHTQELSAETSLQ